MRYETYKRKKKNSNRETKKEKVFLVVFVERSWKMRWRSCTVSKDIRKNRKIRGRKILLNTFPIKIENSRVTFLTLILPCSLSPGQKPLRALVIFPVVEIKERTSV